MPSDGEAEKNTNVWSISHLRRLAETACLPGSQRSNDSPEMPGMKPMVRAISFTFLLMFPKFAQFAQSLMIPIQTLLIVSEVFQSAPGVARWDITRSDRFVKSTPHKHPNHFRSGTRSTPDRSMRLRRSRLRGTNLVSSRNLLSAHRTIILDKESQTTSLSARCVEYNHFQISTLR